MALDLETKNLSNEIGGWGNTHMFVVSTVCTYDGTTMKTYADENDIQKEGVFPLRQLKFDLDDHFEKGGFLLGHNIRGFDLPVLREVLIDMNNCLMATPDQLSSWNRALNLLKTNSELSSKLSKKAKLDQENKFTWGKRNC